MLTRLRCSNYRSLEDVDVPLAGLTAFVGPNGSGKSALLRAINLVCGETWPTMRSIRIPQDFTAYDATRELAITVTLDPPLQHQDALDKTRDIHHLRVRCLPYKRSGAWGEAGDLHLEFEPLDQAERVPSVAISRPPRPQFRPLTVSTDLREQVRILFIDHRRSVVQHLPSVRGSALGRLFEPARRELDLRSGHDPSPRERFRQSYETAMDAIRTPRVQEVEETIRETTRRMLGFLGSGAVRDIDVSFGFADPANPFASLRLEYREGNLDFPAEELGLGVQSAIVVGVFEALRRLGGPIGTVVIEEPEMYLHPQAQRYFYRLLGEMVDAGECQVIYSTHSPIFADVERFEALRLVRKEPSAMSTVSFIADENDRQFLDSHRERLKVSVAFDTARSEMLFARRVLLVEGANDQIAARLAANKMGVDLDAEGLSIVPCGSKDFIPFYARTCRALGIWFCILYDEDRPEARTNTLISEAAGPDHGVFVVSPSLERTLNIRGRDRPRQVAEALRSRGLEHYPAALREAVAALVRGDSRGVDDSARAQTNGRRVDVPSGL